MNKVVATREYYFVAKKTKKVRVKVGLPRKMKSHPHMFECPFVVIGLKKTAMRGIGEGADTLQALQVALERIGLILWKFNKDHPNKLRFYGDNDPDLGLPLGAPLKWI